jgi:ribosomal protein S18 acetylase RimI-like enzyme
MAHRHGQAVRESGSLSPQSQAMRLVQADTPPHLRPIQAVDLPQMVQIEARALRDPWTSEAFGACVQAAAQRCGLGRHMLAHLRALAHSRQARTVLLAVRASNSTAIGLYTVTGFYTIGVRKDYDRTAQGQENVLVMARRL